MIRLWEREGLSLYKIGLSTTHLCISRSAAKNKTFPPSLSCILQSVSITLKLLLSSL